MTRPTLLTAATLAVGLLALTACGSTRAADGGGAPSAVSATGIPSGSASASRSPDVAADAAVAKAAHDKAFPDIAARCAAEGTATAAASGPPDALPTDPEAAKHAENNAFKKQAGLKPEARCRGEAHARRIKNALAGPGAVMPVTEEGLTSALTALGYEIAGGDVYRSGGALGFAYAIKGVGPCVTGWLGSPVKVEAHGAYMEGGCREPRGGH
ncbi:hypothetical protein ACFWUZ_08005 [Streptomyces sp. NPDC058646]|uniref:hypothetical protein n=1 Tax=Streptomyces sp. NPDC058646 TaxID=3346574 RepID=UPI0036674FA0